MKNISKAKNLNTSTVSGYRAPAVGRAFQILKRVAESGNEFGLSRLAQELGFSKSTTHGLLQALISIDALDYDPEQKKYSLGPIIMDLAFGDWNYIKARELAQPHLDELRERIGETVILGGLNRRRGIIIAASESTKPLKISAMPGSTIPVMAGAVGKIFLSRFSDTEVLKIIKNQKLKKYTPASIVDEAACLTELARVREQMYALDLEEYIPGVNAIAVNLGNRGGMMLAIWVVGFAGYMNNGNVSQIVSEMFATSEKLRLSLDMNAKN